MRRCSTRSLIAISALTPSTLPLNLLIGVGVKACGGGERSGPATLSMCRQVKKSVREPDPFFAYTHHVIMIGVHAHRGSSTPLFWDNMKSSPESTAEYFLPSPETNSPPPEGTNTGESLLLARIAEVDWPRARRLRFWINTAAFWRAQAAFKQPALVESMASACRWG